MTNGTIERKCMKGHKKAEGSCSSRCVRWYPRIQRATPDAHSRRKFDYLGGYPTKAAARAALQQALGRQEWRFVAIAKRRSRNMAVSTMASRFGALEGVEEFQIAHARN